VVKGIGVLRVTLGSSLKQHDYFIFYIVDTSDQVFSVRTLKEDIVKWYTTLEERPTLAKVWYTGRDVCCSRDSSSPPPDTKHKPRLATQGAFDTAMHNACTYVLVLNYPIILTCTNVICTTAQNADIQGAFLDFFRNIQLR
jgi:hypothetical protein